MYRISDHVASCLKLFRSTAINGLPNSSNEFVAFRITDEFARFKVWSSNIGAHRIGKSSLDYRLRDASHLQKQVENLLTDLSNSLKNALSILSGEKVPWDELLVEEEDYGQDVDGPTHGNVEFDTELDQILADITEVVDCLLRLSVSIRNPAPHDRLRASGRINVSHYETSDISHVATKFDSADPKLSECLGKANSRRRQYFRYRASHHGILSEGLDADFSKSEFEGQSTVASSIPQSQKGKVPNLRLNCIDEDELSDSGITQSSFATTRGDGGPHIPALPAKASKGPFECPFCYMMISVSSRRAWKKHIFADLRPYNCLVLDCPVVGIDFARRHQWMDHILQKHWRLWHCAFCSHPPFNSSESFQGHLQNSHGEIASNDQLIASLELSTNQRPLDNPSNCPLCQEPMSSTNEYKRHVGRHLEDIALFVLPTPDDDSGDENLEDLTSMDIDDSSTESSDSGAGEGEAVNALSETDNHSWMEIEVGREPVEDFFGYNTPIRPSTNLVEIGLNAYRTARVAEVLDELRTTNYYMAAEPVDPPNIDDFYTEGWAVLRQCSIDAQHIVNAAADITVPQAGGDDAEQAKAELKQILLDAFSRRHEAHKIYRRQKAAKRWIENCEMVLQGQRPNASYQRALRVCDAQLRTDLSSITDQSIYLELQASDMALGRWVAEDPSLRTVQRWVQARPQTT